MRSLEKSCTSLIPFGTNLRTALYHGIEAPTTLSTLLSALGFVLLAEQRINREQAAAAKN
ncbi:hypothetical protein SAMN04488688_101538 [Paenibacillus sp. cl141a]|nr:hypothetical protein SAMN04488688_101538 [Paenibacillus sp. cl141a]